MLSSLHAPNFGRNTSFWQNLVTHGKEIPTDWLLSPNSFCKPSFLELLLSCIHKLPCDFLFDLLLPCWSQDSRRQGEWEHQEWVGWAGHLRSGNVRRQPPFSCADPDGEHPHRRALNREAPECNCERIIFRIYPFVSEVQPSLQLSFNSFLKD